MNASPMMACGHSANASHKGAPVCAICFGSDEAELVVLQPNLEGRKAKCSCGSWLTSSTGLAFFEHLPNEKFDRFYCGCRGWN